jgi:hypothetical protein
VEDYGERKHANGGRRELRSSTLLGQVYRLCCSALALFAGPVRAIGSALAILSKRKAKHGDVGPGGYTLFRFERIRQTTFDLCIVNLFELT